MLYTADLILTVRAMKDKESMGALHFIKTVQVPEMPKPGMAFIVGGPPDEQNPYKSIEDTWDYFRVSRERNAVAWDTRRHVFRCELREVEEGYSEGWKQGVLAYYQRFGFTERPPF